MSCTRELLADSHGVYVNHKLHVANSLTMTKLLMSHFFLSVGKIHREQNKVVYELATIVNQEVKSSSCVFVYLFLAYHEKKEEKAKYNTYKLHVACPFVTST